MNVKAVKLTSSRRKKSQIAEYIVVIEFLILCLLNNLLLIHFKMSQKRGRSTNFTREEVEILIRFVDENKHVLENKKSDAVTWQEKERCWKAIETAFNCASGVTHRNAKTLRLKYEGLKRETRKKSALIRAETYRTGGGPSTAPALTPSEEKVKSMILLSVDGMESIYDSDQVPNALVSLPPDCNNSDTEIDFNLSNGNPDEIIQSLEGLSENTSTETPVQSLKRNLGSGVERNTDSPLRPMKLTFGSEGPENTTIAGTPARPMKRTLVDNQRQDYTEEPESFETGSRWSQWKPASLRSRKHPVLSKPKPKRPFEKLAETKLEMTELQKKILEEELVHNRLKFGFEENEREQQQKRWEFEEEERQHKREMWALEKKLF